MAGTRAVVGQDYTTLFGTSATDMKRQNHEFVTDVSAHNKVVVNYNILNADDITLYLETAQVKDKMYWRTTQSWNAVGSGSIVLTRDAGLTSEFLENFLRWRLAATGANYQITFSLDYFLK